MSAELKKVKHHLRTAVETITSWREIQNKGPRLITEYSFESETGHASITLSRSLGQN